jgi:cytochrome c1
MKLHSKTLIASALIVMSLAAGTFLTEETAIAQNTASAAPADPMQFSRGAQAWANNCTRCHNMRDPKELRDDQWRAAVTHMRIRAGLTGQEARDILAFLQRSN